MNTNRHKILTQRTSRSRFLREQTQDVTYFGHECIKEADQFLGCSRSNKHHLGFDMHKLLKNRSPELKLSAKIPKRRVQYGPPSGFGVHWLGLCLSNSQNPTRSWYPDKANDKLVRYLSPLH